MRLQRIIPPALLLFLLATSIVSAQESGWEVISARPYNNVLLGIDMSSRLQAVAVGERGLVRRTSTGGREWSLEPIPTSMNLNAVAFATSDLVVAVGNGGVIFRSEDAGGSWSRVPSPVLDSLLAVDFADANRGVAVGVGGIVIRTTDGGRSWEEIEGFGAETINDVAFDNSGRGVLVGEKGSIATSDDFGATWEVTPKLANGRLTDLLFTGSRWMIAGEPWIFLRSDDGAATWQSHAIISDPSEYPRSEVMVFGAFDDSTITLGIIDRYVPMNTSYRSTDGGASWAMDHWGSIGGFGRAMSAFDGTGIAVGRQFVYRTTDRGALWDDIETGVTTFYKGVAFADSLHGFAMAEDNKIVFDSLGQIAGGPWAALDVTTDGGATWTTHRVHEGWNVNLRSGSYPDRSLAMVVGDSGLALRSSDGGLSWQRVDLGTRTRLDEVSFADPLHGVITGLGGLLLRTEDGGVTWSRLDSIANYLYQLATPSAERIIGITGTISTGLTLHLSTDAGESWSEHEYNTSATSSFFLDSLRGWTATGLRSASSQGQQQNDVVYRTTDGGMTWTKMLDSAIGVPFGLSDIAFADEHHGFAVGAAEKIIHTIDGGITWRHHPFTVTGSEAFRSVSYPAPGRAFAVTALGQMLRYTSQAPSHVAGREQPAGALDLELWPNPARSTLRLRFLLASRSQVGIRIFDPLGREVGPAIDERRERGEQNIELDLGALEEGTYFIEVTGDGRAAREQLLVIR